MSGPKKTRLYKTPIRGRGSASEISYLEISKHHQQTQQTELIQKFGKSERLAHALADASHALELRFSQEIGSKMKTDCKSGCSFCCHQPATVFGFEAIRIAQILRQSLSEAQLQALVLKMLERVNGFNGQSVKQNINNKEACPLLVDHKCSVYVNRPLTCRLAHSFSVSRCELAFKQSRAKTQIPISIELLTGVSGIIEAAYEQLPTKGLDGSLYELCSAVLAALSNPLASAEWASGTHNPFVECIRDDT